MTVGELARKIGGIVGMEESRVCLTYVLGSRLHALATLNEWRYVGSGEIGCRLLLGQQGVQE